MIYTAYQACHDLLTPVRTMAGMTAQSLRRMQPQQLFWGALPFAAACEMMETAALSHTHPDWNIGPTVLCDGRECEVSQEAVLRTPFATLLRFGKQGAPRQPRVLLVAPISGHFATLLRPTVDALLPDHDVYVTDWTNARDVPVSAGRFGFDEHIDHLIAFLRATGPGTHLFAVCQPCPSAVAATALMSEDNDPCTPASLVLMAGPIDTRVNPTAVSEFAVEHPLEWFRAHLVTAAPFGSAGASRHVYPGFLQIGAFMSMNLERHMSQHGDLFRALARGEVERADPIRAFYDEYYAVSDLTAELFLETVDRVFQRHLLPKGELDWRGRRVDPGRIDRTPVMTIEGERDDICSPGQTAAVHALLTGLPDHMKRRHLQEGAGHYGVFSGSRWRSSIRPAAASFIAAWDQAAAEAA
jgi:polyhydroxyalkanoate depolymerase